MQRTRQETDSPLTFRSIQLIIGSLFSTDLLQRTDHLLFNANDTALSPFYDE